MLILDLRAKINNVGNVCVPYCFLKLIEEMKFDPVVMPKRICVSWSEDAQGPRIFLPCYMKHTLHLPFLLPDNK